MRSISSVSIYISYSSGSNKNLIGMPIIPFVPFNWFSVLPDRVRRGMLPSKGVLLHYSMCTIHENISTVCS